MAITVSQSGRIARPKRPRPPPGPHRPLPSLPPARRPSRSGRRSAAAALRRPEILGAPAARLRRRACATLARGAGAGRARRQPHRADVHRRSQRRLALRCAPPRGLRDAADLRAPRRRPAPARRRDHRHHPLRAAAEQALARRDRPLRALLAGRAAPARPRARGGGARPHRLAGLPALAAAAGPGAGGTHAAVRSWRGHALRGRRDAAGLLSPEPAEHVHRQADAADAARRVPGGAPVAGARVSETDRERLAACRACGNRVTRGARRCPACGTREPTADVSDRAEPAAPEAPPAARQEAPFVSARPPAGESLFTPPAGPAAGGASPPAPPRPAGPPRPPALPLPPRLLLAPTPARPAPP